MSRKLGILAGVLASGLGVAAMVNAQNAAPTRSPSLSDRLSQIRDQLVGEDDGAEEPTAAPATSQRRPTDWSAGRKFGAPSRSRTADDALPAAPQHNVPPPTQATEQGPQRRTANSASASRTAAPSRTPSRSTTETPAGRKPIGNYARRPDPTREPARSTVADRAAASSTASPSVASPVDTAPTAAAPRPVPGGVATESPLRNRLQALREERFDKAVSDADLTVQGKAAVKEPVADKTDAAASSAAQWRSAAPETKVETPSVAAPSAPATASRYRDEPSAVTKTDEAKSDAHSSAPTADAHKAAAAANRAGRYANDRGDATPKTPAAGGATREAPAYVARRDALRPSQRDNVASAAKPADAPKATTEDASAGAGGALLASNSPILSVKTLGPRTITIGKPAKYELLLENSGDAAANEVLVTVKLPAWAQIEGAQATSGAAKVAAKQSQGASDASDSLQWRVSRLDAGGKQRLVMQVVPKQSTPFQLAVQWTFEPEVAKTVVEVQEPKLQIALDGPKEMLYGANEVYRITVSNPGTGDAENVAVLTGGASPGEGMNKLVVGTLAAGATKTLELNVAAAQAGTLHIAAKATADGNLSSQAAADVLVRRAALQLAAGGPKANYAGTQAAYEVRVANPGNATAENVRIEATLPIGAKFDKCSAGGTPAADGTKVVWTVPSLAAGSERAFELTCTLMAAGANRLQVAAAAQGQLADAAEVATRVEAVADLKLEVADPRGPVAVGADAVYEVRIRNRGTKTAERINVVGFFSEGIEPVSATGMKYTLEAGQITFATIDALDPNEEVVAKVTARASTAGNHLFRAELVCESTETRLVVEETTKFYADGPVKPATYLEEVDAAEADAGQVEDAVEHADESTPSAHGATPSLLPPAAGEGELQPLNLSTEVDR